MKRSDAGGNKRKETGKRDTTKLREKVVIEVTNKPK